jgi:hypothetical protein
MDLSKAMPLVQWAYCLCADLSPQFFVSVLSDIESLYDVFPAFEFGHDQLIRL